MEACFPETDRFRSPREQFGEGIGVAPLPKIEIFAGFRHGRKDERVGRQADQAEVDGNTVRDKAFDEKLLDAAIKSAGQFVIISSGPEPFAYRVAATAAVRDRRNVLLIETQPHQQEAWRSRIEEIRGADAPIFICVPHPTEATT